MAQRTGYSKIDDAETRNKGLDDNNSAVRSKSAVSRFPDDGDKKQ